jgi:hypothetical protein
MRRTVTGLLAVTLLLAAAACEKVPKPSSDPTPPTLKWHVENRTTNTATDVTGTGAVSGKKGDEFRVTLIANDPQGIHKITMGGGYTRNCQGDGLGQTGNGDYAGQTQTLDPDAQGQVLTQIFLIQSITPDVDCSNGFTWTGTSIGLNGSGTNYFNGTTNGTLTINVTP